MSFVCLNVIPGRIYVDPDPNGFFRQRIQIMDETFELNLLKCKTQLGSGIHKLHNVTNFEENIS